MTIFTTFCRLGTGYALFALTLAACRSTTASDVLPDLAHFHPDAIPAAITLPDAVTAGIPFNVAIATLTGQCRRAGRTDLRISGQVAVITLYPDSECSHLDIGVVSPRTVSVRFDTPGSGAVRVIGEGQLGPQTIERIISVRAP